jgi:hypothetical protein
VAEPPAESLPTRASAPPQAINVRIQDAPGKHVDVRFVDAQGTVKVVVRSGDPQLAAAIQAELPQFERTLETKGLASEFRSEGLKSESKNAEPHQAGASERISAGITTSSMESSDRNGSGDRERRTNWEEEMEDRTNAAALRRLMKSRENQ